MIRKVRYEDKDEYIKLIRLFVEERMAVFGIRFDEVNSEAQFDMFFKMDTVSALVMEENGELIGTIVGVFGPLMFCEGVVAQEMVWYVKPEHRGLNGLRLIREFENVAKFIGCSAIIMIGMDKDPANNFYIKDGYVPLQNNFYKRL